MVSKSSTSVEAEKRFNKELQDALKEDRVIVGVERCFKSLKAKNARMIALANNCPVKDKLRLAAADCGTEVVEFVKLSNVELGELCKKPFRVSTATILENKMEGA